MRLRSLLALAVLTTGALGVTAATTAPAEFDITLERTATGWSATCTTGCAWNQVSMECASVCQAVVSERGMRTQRSEDLAAEAFAFVVEPRDGRGWRAVAIRGTAWTATAVGCGEGRCRTRIDGRGVTRL